VASPAPAKLHLAVLDKEFVVSHIPLESHFSHVPTYVPVYPPAFIEEFVSPNVTDPCFTVGRLLVVA